MNDEGSMFWIGASLAVVSAVDSSLTVCRGELCGLYRDCLVLCHVAILCLTLLRLRVSCRTVSPCMPVAFSHDHGAIGLLLRLSFLSQTPDSVDCLDTGPGKPLVPSRPIRIVLVFLSFLRGH